MYLMAQEWFQFYLPKLTLNSRCPYNFVVSIKSTKYASQYSMLLNSYIVNIACWLFVGLV